MLFSYSDLTNHEREAMSVMLQYVKKGVRGVIPSKQKYLNRCFLHHQSVKSLDDAFFLKKSAKLFL